MSDILSELSWRGLIQDQTDGLAEFLAKNKTTLYTGFDPTADSLHVGSLVPMIALARWQRFGHTPIAIAGGGTGMIGDPSGRSQERNLLTPDRLNYNLEKIKGQLAMLVDFEVKSNPAKIVNNADWLASVSMMDFLRNVGKHFTVNYMVSKDSVKSRLEREGEGISFTEFSYMLLQAYDFLVLHNEHNCQVQAGGSDQWGNITAGVELIRRVKGEKAHGLVYPLITKSDGSKFGKTAAGAIWLDPEKTSPYRFYQFWFRSEDNDVIDYLKFFTWLDEAAVAELAHATETAAHERAAQRRLAQEMTMMVHGQDGLSKAEQASEVLFGGDLDGLSGGDIADIFADVPSSELPLVDIEGEGKAVLDLLTMTSVCSSKGDARRAIQGGGIYLNNQRVTDNEQMATLADSVEGQFLVLRRGRKKYHLVKILR
ncbi:MAG TPA: tyrosine--tRNA ligase [Anaerolineae bacterium]|nr:tyrosine--tRNA ligase [Anaerolineae bacterium]